MHHCDQCGNDITAGDEFCLECGARIQKSSVQQTQSTFCVECGEAYPEEGLFCIHCGTKKPEDDNQDAIVRDEHDPDLVTQELSAFGIEDQQDDPKQSIRAQADSTEKTVRTEPKKKLATWKKVLLITSIAFLLLVFGAYKYGQHYFDPMKDLVKMDEAILNNDVSGFMKFVDWDEEIPFDQESYFTYIKEHEWEDDLKTDYYALIEREKEDPTPLQKELTSTYGAPLFKVEDEKIFFGLFKGYTLHAVPVKVSAISNLDDTEVSIMDDTVTMEDADEWSDIGTFYPGVYEIKATTKTEFGDFDLIKDYTIHAEEDADVHVEYDFGMFTLNVDGKFDDAIIYINEESTKKKASEVERFGPIPFDNKVKIHAEWEDDKSNVFRSNTIQLDRDESDYIYLEFDERIALDSEDIDEAEHDIAEFILDFRMAYEDAVNYADYDDIAAFMKQGSEEEKDLKKFVKDMDNASYYYEFEENTITNVKKKDDKNYEAETNERFTFYDEDGSVYEYDRDKVYFIEVIDGDYKVHNIDYKDTKKNKIN